MKYKKINSIRNLFVLLFLIPFFANSEPPPDSKLILQYGDFCRFFKINEIEYKLEWGKENIRNISFKTFDTSEILRCNLVIETDEFTVLKIAKDTGTHKSIILPLNRTSQEIQYQNAICVDLEDKTIILENPSQDSMLIVENFINKKRIVLGKSFIPCQSSSPHDCIDSLIFYNSHLTFNWITPGKHSKDKKIEFKKFNIRLK